MCPNICPVLSVQHNWTSESDTRIIHTTSDKFKAERVIDRIANARTKTIRQKM